MSDFLLAIDQGTTSSRAMIFTRESNVVGLHQINLTQSYPEAGWVEQNPEEMWANTLACCRTVLQKNQLKPEQIAAIGITNQRETTIIWDRKTGQPIYPAIVWQDRRTSDICKQFSHHAIHAQLQDKTGLVLDPYFSATKIMWLLNTIPHARERAEKGELAFGTVDSFLLWRLTNGKVHATDATNASRTLLYNIKTQAWDEDILNAFAIPKSLLPVVLDSSADFGKTASEHFGISIPIASLIGDQQAATVGQACFEKGMVKSTYGTGCFMLLNTGPKMIHSKNRLLTTIAYRLNGVTTYGLEGSIFCAGAIVKWMRDTLKLIKSADETELLARQVSDTEGVYLVPAFTGLGAPYWDPEARGALLGMTLNSGIPQIVRAGLEAVVYQSKDLLEAMVQDSQTNIVNLRVDGGMTVNGWLLQFLADILRVEIQSPACIETTALGAAFLAGLQVGVYKSLKEIADLWKAKNSFRFEMEQVKCEKFYHGWKNAVSKVVT